MRLARFVRRSHASAQILARGLGSSQFCLSDEIRARIAPHDYERYEKEQLIIVDEQNREVGQTNIVLAHLTDNVQRLAQPHRAFSVLLFDADFNMLLQKRAASKPIFPGYWANACCSHPLKNVPLEDDATDGLGAIRAATRRIPFELGVAVSQERIKLASILLYTAVYDATFAECEMDYVLACQLEQVKPSIPFNPKEVSAVQWLSAESFGSTLAQLQTSGEKLAPWLQYIREIGLEDWWRVFREDGRVSTLHRSTEPVVHSSFSRSHKLRYND